MEFDFLTESPSKKDRFNSKSHQLVADSIVSVFESKQDIQIVGLEGGLGSGKSTVIELIKDNPDCKLYKFFVFDVEQHHYSSTKKAFISLFSDWILGFCDKDKEKAVANAKDKALGNVLEYEKKNRSNISWWTIGFIISLLFSASSMRPLFSHLDLYFTENNYEFFCLELLLWGGLFILPGLLLLLLASISKFSNNDDKDSKIPTVGDLFKRNTVDSISERLEVTREVGSIELRDSMKVFVGSIPSGIKCILVIDNLDRVSPDKVKEVWSDLEIFISATNSALKIILPFSSKHIADAISDNDDGYEFIAKRIPVSFRVPPIVSVGWQETFEKFWHDASNQTDSQTIKSCADILDLLLPKSFNGHVTPRLMKRYINDIYSLKITTPIDIHPVVSAFYIAAVNYGDETYTVESIIQNPPTSDIIGSIHKKLNLISSSDIEWPIQIMCLHYQTTPEIAKSELLIQPLDRALKQHDPDAFIERADIYGFKDACVKIISKNSYIDIIKLANALLETNEEFTKFWLQEHIAVVNHEIDEQLKLAENQIYDADLVKALLNLLNKDYPLEISPLNTLYYKNLVEVKEELNDGKTDGNIFDSLDSLYLYSKLTKKIPEIISEPDGEFYIKTLWAEKNNWTYWGVEKIALSSDQVGDVILALYSDPNEIPTKDQTSNIIKRIRLGWFDFEKGLNKQSPFTINDYTSFIQNADIKNIQVLVFDHRWYSQDLIQQYISYVNRINQPAVKEELIAQALVNIIQRSAYQLLAQWKTVADQHPGYKKYISMYLPLVSSFSAVMDAFDRPEISGDLKESLSALITSGKIHRLKIDEVLTEYYSTIKSAVKDTSQLLSWSDGWRRHIDSDDISLENFDKTFVADVLSLSDKFKGYKEVLYSKIDTDTIDKGEWIDLLFSKHENMFSIIEHMRDSAYCLSYPSALMEAIEELLTSNVHVESMKSIDDSLLFDLLLSIIEENLRSVLLKKLSKSLLIQSVTDAVKERLIINLGTHISLPIAKEQVDQEIIKDLLGSITITQVIAEWFDKQAFYFNKWRNEDMLEIAKPIYKHRNWFNKLLVDKHLEKSIESIKKAEEKLGGGG